MGSGFGKKTKKTDFGSYYRSPEEYEAMKWCIKNGITIGPLAAEKVKTTGELGDFGKIKDIKKVDTLIKAYSSVTNRAKASLNLIKSESLISTTE